ncbi:MAG: class I SAM-dependent methyltransferase [Opitutaceae bacterium]|nr:class I SAM-dependent methyltransferase [Opitutaceae bacterium]
MSDKISAETVRRDFDDIHAVLHYTRAAHHLGLWASERLLIERFFPDRTACLLELGCGAGRVTLGLWGLGYRHLTAVDFSGELLEQARSLAAERGATDITFIQADATRLHECHPLGDLYNGAIFAFNGLMQIPGRENRRQALREIHRLCQTGAPLLFTTHDRDDAPSERTRWAEEAARWARGGQDPRLVEFGDRYFADEYGGMTFIHLPDRREILDDLAATGWRPISDSMRRDIAIESRVVREFSDECRIWVAQKQ